MLFRSSNEDAPRYMVRPMCPVKSSSCLATLGKVLLETHCAQDALVVRSNDTEVVHLQLLVALYLKVNGNIYLSGVHSGAGLFCNSPFLTLPSLSALATLKPQAGLIVPQAVPSSQPSVVVSVPAAPPAVECAWWPISLLCKGGGGHSVLLWHSVLLSPSSLPKVPRHAGFPRGEHRGSRHRFL